LLAEEALFFKMMCFAGVTGYGAFGKERE